MFMNLLCSFHLSLRVTTARPSSSATTVRSCHQVPRSTKAKAKKLDRSSAPWSTSKQWRRAGRLLRVTSLNWERFIRMRSREATTNHVLSLILFVTKRCVKCVNVCCSQVTIHKGTKASCQSFSTSAVDGKIVIWKSSVSQKRKQFSCQLSCVLFLF